MPIGNGLLKRATYVSIGIMLGYWLFCSVYFVLNPGVIPRATPPSYPYCTQATTKHEMLNFPLNPIEPKSRNLPVNGVSHEIRLCRSIKLSDGRTLLVGGEETVSDKALNRTWLLSATGKVSEGPLLKHRSVYHALCQINDGRVLIIGGLDKTTGKALGSVEIFNPTNNTINHFGKLNVPRYLHECTVGLGKNSNSVFVAGGCTDRQLSDSGDTLTATIEKGDITTGNFIIVGQLHQARFRHRIERTADGKADIIGGDFDEPNYNEPLKTESLCLSDEMPIASKTVRLPTVGEIVWVYQTLLHYMTTVTPIQQDSKCF